MDLSGELGVNLVSAAIDVLSGRPEPHGKAPGEQSVRPKPEGRSHCSASHEKRFGGHGHLRILIKPNVTLNFLSVWFAGAQKRRRDGYHL